MGSQPRGRDSGSEKPRAVRVYRLGVREERGILRAPDTARRPTPWSDGMQMSIGLVDFVYLVNSFMV